MRVTADVGATDRASGRSVLPLTFTLDVKINLSTIPPAVVRGEPGLRFANLAVLGGIRSWTNHRHEPRLRIFHDKSLRPLNRSRGLRADNLSAERHDVAGAQALRTKLRGRIHRHAPGGLPPQVPGPQKSALPAHEYEESARVARLPCCRAGECARRPPWLRPRPSATTSLTVRRARSPQRGDASRVRVRWHTEAASTGVVGRRFVSTIPPTTTSLPAGGALPPAAPAPGAS